MSDCFKPMAIIFNCIGMGSMDMGVRSSFVIIDVRSVNGFLTWNSPEGRQFDWLHKLTKTTCVN